MTGIPQSSSFRLLLFLVYINVLALLDLPSQLVLFAEDNTISALFANYGEACWFIATDLKTNIYVANAQPLVQPL